MSDREKNVLNLSLSLKLLLIMNGIVLACFLIFGLVVTESSTEITSRLSRKSLSDITDLVLQQIGAAVDASIKNYLRGIAEKNRELLSSLYARYQKGLLSEQEAKKLASELLLSQKIGKTGYIYSLNSSGHVKVHPLLAYNYDASSFAFVRRQMQEKSGYLEYDWKNPGESEKKPKALYMEYFEPWDWIISVSSYRKEFISLVKVEQLRENILSIQIGKTGYISVLNSQGEVLIHPHIEGGNVLQTQDENGRYFVQEMIERKNGELVYQWRNPGESVAREKMAIYKYYEELDWIVTAGIYLDELYEETHQLRVRILAITCIALCAVILVTVAVRLKILQIERKNEALAADVEKRNHTLEVQRQQLLEAEKMASLGQLVAGVAHEINTPLGASISSSSYLAMINTTYRRKLSQNEMTKQDLKAYMNSVNETVGILTRNLHRTVELMKSFKQVAADQTGMIEERFLLKKYIHTILLSLKHEYKARPIHFDIICDDTLVMTSFPGAFSQIFTNLIMNSLVHGFSKDEEGRIGIHCQKDSQRLTIEYTDNGKGIPETQLGKIFEPFFTTSRQAGGSGLGLSVVYNIVTQKLHGTISCTSQKGRGTRFFINVPLKEENHG